MVPGLRQGAGERRPRELQGGDESHLTRCFIALGLDPAPGPALAGALDGLRESFPELSVPPPANLHLTLVFLGELDDAGVGQAGEAVAAAALEVARGWPVEWGSPGAFPTSRRPRVLWLGLADAGPTIAARAAVVAKLGDVAVAVEDRAYRPHLTLARLRREVSSARAAELAEALSGLPHPPAARVDSLVLYSSRLGGGGPPVYEALRSAALG